MYTDYSVTKVCLTCQQSFDQDRSGPANRNGIHNDNPLQVGSLHDTGVWYGRATALQTQSLSSITQFQHYKNQKFLRLVSNRYSTVGNLKPLLIFLESRFVPFSKRVLLVSCASYALRRDEGGLPEYAKKNSRFRVKVSFRVGIFSYSLTAFLNPPKFTPFLVRCKTM